jgi:hypothetical protein
MDSPLFDRTLSHPLLAFASFAGGAFVLYACYYLYLCPIARFPGPFWARLTNGWKTVHIIRYNLSDAIREAHDRYGPIVRVGPNQLSLCAPEAIKETLGAGPTFEKTWAGRRRGLGGRSQQRSQSLLRCPRRLRAQYVLVPERGLPPVRAPFWRICAKFMRHTARADGSSTTSLHSRPCSRWSPSWCAAVREHDDAVVLNDAQDHPMRAYRQAFDNAAQSGREIDVKRWNSNLVSRGPYCRCSPSDDRSRWSMPCEPGHR